MDVRTYPLEAVALERGGRPWYPFTPPGDSGEVLFLADPVLTVPGAQWAQVPEKFADCPHLPLDEPHMAVLLSFAKTPGSPYVPFDPDQLVPDNLLELLAGVLTACHCDPSTLDEWLVDEYASSQYRDRLDQCRAAVHRAVAS